MGNNNISSMEINTIYWMGVKIETTIPKELMIKIINVAQKDTETFKALTEWGIPELKRQNN